MMKNAGSQRYNHLMNFQIPFRLLLTGTPLQNNLQELLSLLTFIMPDLFSANSETLTKLFSYKPPSAEDPLSHERIERAKKMMSPFILRRRKDMVLDDLPSKIQVLENCTATPVQRELYQRVLRDSKKEQSDPSAEVSKMSRSKIGAFSNAKQLTNVMMQLRKVANHPLLMRSIYTDDKLKVISKNIMRVFGADCRKTSTLMRTKHIFLKTCK
jgi:SWI/SNF-related matrix-associated actin-dependent regulator of chromatin subfamily A containing DEAD/H box 1